MGGPALRRLSYAEYLAIEATSGQKHELVDGVVVAMAGGTYAHGLVIANAIRALGNALAGRPCRVLSPDNRLRIPGALDLTVQVDLLFEGL